MKKIIPFLLLLFLLGIIYLPGPNGLFALIRKKIENRRLKEEISDLRIKNILLRAERQKLSSPQYWEELIKRREAKRER
ncbi:MAG: hypothetical protein ABIK97_00450 [candidate division WOR-3 bacterium]